MAGIRAMDIGEWATTLNGMVNDHLMTTATTRDRRAAWGAHFDMGDRRV
jgi:hypothetical protein